MYRAAAALKTFFSGFGLPAYAESSVPDDVVLPYITYSISVPEWNQKTSLYAQVWDRTRSNMGIISKADQITGDIGERKTIPMEDGFLVIWPETPLVQIRVDGDYRCAYINLSVNAYHMPGV